MIAKCRRKRLSKLKEFYAIITENIIISYVLSQKVKIFAQMLSSMKMFAEIREF